MRHPHKWEEMLPEEFFEEFERSPIAYWACGAMEDHGLQNALAADPYIAYEICLRAVNTTGGILFPIVPFAPAGYPGYSRKELRSKEKQLYYPSLWVSREICKDLYIEIMESMSDMGFKSCVGFCGHWPGDMLLQEITKEKNGRIGDMRFWGGGTSILQDVWAEEDKKNPGISGHGTMDETSTLMAVREDWVDLARVKRINESPIASQVKGIPQIKLDKIMLANTEFGNRMLNIAAERIAKKAKKMLDT